MIDTRFVARHARRFRLVATGAVTLVGDIRRHLRNESHRTRPASQRVMRQAHVLTHGRSHQLLATTVRAARRSTREIGEQLPDVLGLPLRSMPRATRSGQVMSIGARRMTSGPTSPISGVRPSEQASSAASIAGLQTWARS